MIKVKTIICHLHSLNMVNNIKCLKELKCTEFSIMIHYYISNSMLIRELLYKNISVSNYEFHLYMFVGLFSGEYFLLVLNTENSSIYIFSGWKNTNKMDSSWSYSLQEIFFCKWCMELWHCHVGSNVIWRKTILGDV